MGVAFTLAGGVLWIKPGDYAGIGVYDKAMTLQAPNGTVTIGR